MQEESPGSIGQGQSLTATGGNPRESATETIPPRQRVFARCKLGGLPRGKGEMSEVRARSTIW